MDGIQENIYKLRLDSLGNDWVDSVYYDFIGLEELPSEYEDSLQSICVQDVFESLILDSEKLQESVEGTWADLSQEIEFKKLLALIGHFIQIGITQATNAEVRDTAVLAARLYFRLLSIPGARAYNVYHSQLFAHSISCLQLPSLMCEKNNHVRNNRVLSEEVNAFLHSLTEFVMDLKAIIFKLKLSPDEMDFEEILSNLLDVSGGAITQTLSNVDKILLSNISGTIYQVIMLMMSNYGGQPNRAAIKILFGCIIQKLHAATCDSKQSSMIVRASYVTYTGVILTSFGTSVIGLYTCMLEHLCTDGETIERAEIRVARAELIVGMMSLLPSRRHRRFIKWVLLLSTNLKLAYRQLALEIISRLLNHEPEVNEQRNNIWDEIEKAHQLAKTLENVTADHCYGRPQGEVDSADSSQDNDDDSDASEGEEEEVAGILRTSAHTVPLASMLEAVLESAVDIASSVRQRALHVLADSAHRSAPHVQSALQEIDGKGRIGRLTALAAKSACDPRAVVRRAGVTLLLRLLLWSDHAPAPEDFAILVKLCRDAAITVRAGAIAAIAEVLLHRPTHVAMEAFLAGPLYQLTDPENKIQEQVKTLIEQIVLKRLTKYSPGCADDILPWMFLQGIIARNIRRLLLNACSALARTHSSISVRLIDILSSHLGAVDATRDLQVLVLLTCAAPHVHYGDVSFVLAHYYKLLEQPRTGPGRLDFRHLSLTLELISSWVQFLSPEDKESLRSQLVRRLAHANSDGCRVATGLLAFELEPTNAVWATELLQISEKQALASGNLEEGLRAVDLSLSAPTPPSSELLNMFLVALHNPPPDWDPEIAGLCVVAAGRLCLRSREAARLTAPALARLLHGAAPLPARVNALMTLQDISSRHPCLVEPQLAGVCGCLRAEAPARLRRTAVRALTELLLAGYLRLRTPLYYDYCALLSDADHDVREPAEYYVTCCLQVDVIYQHFVDCVLYYNEHNADSLNFDARQLIYDVMLQRLTIIQKLNTQCRLAREILVHAADLADDEAEIPPALNSALLDTIRLLTGPRMRLPRKPKETGESADVEDLQERVTTNIVSLKMKRTVAEVLVPAVMTLYARLAGRGGQTAAYLVMLAQDLEHDYKHEIEELLKTDKELMKRIEYFREHHNVDSAPGNSRNLVTSSGPPEPDTPRKRPARRLTGKRRTLKI